MWRNTKGHCCKRCGKYVVKDRDYKFLKPGVIDNRSYIADYCVVLCDKCAEEFVSGLGRDVCLGDVVDGKV